MAKKVQKELRAIHRAFCEHVANGDSPADAYRKVAPGASATSQRVQPYRWLGFPSVQAEIARLRVPIERAKVLTRTRKRELLYSIAEDTKAPPAARTQAIQIDNRMTGDEKPVRVEGEITIGVIFRALQGTTALPSADEREVLEAEVEEISAEEPGDELVPEMERLAR
jgi:hypothetical protein